MSALRRPALERINQLEAACRQKRIAILENYRSNSSNEIKDRLVEPFRIDPELDTLQAFDHSRNDSMHFRLSRIERVSLTEDTWQFEDRHYFKHTDVFRIANNNQVYVQIRLSVFAYNILLEQFPMAKAYLQPSSEVGFYDFETKVNADFLGLINFIMGYTPYLEVISPHELKDLVEMKAKAILRQYS